MNKDLVTTAVAARGTTGTTGTIGTTPISPFSGSTYWSQLITDIKQHTKNRITSIRVLQEWILAQKDAQITVAEKRTSGLNIR
jgi:hypothetical protein